MINNIIDLIFAPLGWILDKGLKDNQKFVSLDRVIYALEDVQKLQQKPFAQIEGLDPRHETPQVSIYTGYRTAIDVSFTGANKTKIKIKDANPKEVISLIRTNFCKEKPLVVETSIGNGHPLRFRYDIEDYDAGKKIRIKGRVINLGRICAFDSSDLNNFSPDYSY